MTDCSHSDTYKWFSWNGFKTFCRTCGTDMDRIGEKTDPNIHYGVACTGCGTWCEHAVYAEGFLCWNCVQWPWWKGEAEDEY